MYLINNFKLTIKAILLFYHFSGGSAMVSKWKTLYIDIIIVLISSTIIALLFNEFRESKIPLFPQHLFSKQCSVMKLSAFQQVRYRNSQCLIFDARPHEFYKKNHMEGALNFPVSQFDFFYNFYLRDIPSDIPIFICGRTRSHASDKELAYHLSLMGYKNVTVIL